MKAEFTAIIEPVPEGGYWAICPEIPGANGQGETIEEAKNSLRQAIELILEDRKADILRGLPEDAIQDKVLIGWNGETWSANCGSLAATWNGKVLPTPFGSTQKPELWKAVLRHSEIKRDQRAISEENPEEFEFGVSDRTTR
jgi:predicted RNase H-like HicB family nuclease